MVVLIAARGVQGVGSGAIVTVAYAAIARGYDETLRLWDVRSGKELATLEAHAGWVQAVAFTPDGKVLAEADSDNVIRLWDVSPAR